MWGDVATMGSVGVAAVLYRLLDPVHCVNTYRPNLDLLCFVAALPLKSCVSLSQFWTSGGTFLRMEQSSVRNGLHVAYRIVQVPSAVHCPVVHVTSLSLQQSGSQVLSSDWWQGMFVFVRRNTHRGKIKALHATILRHNKQH
jgi:hypothetical protein